MVAEVKYGLGPRRGQNARFNVYASLGIHTFPVSAVNGSDPAGLKRAAQARWLGIGVEFAEAPRFLACQRDRIHSR